MRPYIERSSSRSGEDLGDGENLKKLLLRDASKV